MSDIKKPSFFKRLFGVGDAQKDGEPR